MIDVDRVQRAPTHATTVSYRMLGQIIGQMQSDKATELYKMPGMELASTIDYVHAYVQMTGRNVSDPETGAQLGHLCSPAMGDAFAAGACDLALGVCFDLEALIVHTNAPILAVFLLVCML